MQTISRALRTWWRWPVLFLVTLVPRLYLLRVYDIELSEDGFDAVNTLTTWQTQGLGAVPRELIDRFILHPLYMLLLAALKSVVPTSIDFYFAARLLSSLIACIAVILLFEFTRRAFNEPAAWVAALFLAFAPSFLWESVAILSSTLFLALYLAVLFALLHSRYRLAGFLAFLSALTRYEGIVLIALVLVALLVREIRAVRARALIAVPSAARPRGNTLADWLICVACALAFPLTLAAAGAIATGNAFEFAGAQSMAAIWLRFLAPGDFFKRAAFFITQYPALFPPPIVWLGIAGAVGALVWQRTRATALLIGTTSLFLLFFEALVWFNYTTLEVRFLMYPGLPLLVFAGVALEGVRHAALVFGANARRQVELVPLGRARWRVWVGTVFSYPVASLALGLVVAALVVLSYRQGDEGMRFLYNMMASQREVAAELAPIVPPNQKTNLMVYTGNAGALGLFGLQRGMQLTFTDFRFAPDDGAEQYLIDRKIQYVIYPVGNPFARAKYPYLAQFDLQTHGAVTFQPLTQFSTSTDNQLYSIWALSFQ